MSNVYITESHPRRLWREHLIGVAVANEVANEEFAGADRSEEARNDARYALADLIASATFLEEESTSDLLSEIADQISTAVDTQIADEETRRQAAKRRRWINEVNAFVTDLGFAEWAQENS